MTYLAVLAIVVLLALLAVREDTPTARTPRLLWADLRASGWRRAIWLALVVTFGTAALAVMAAVRTGLYGALLALAGAACLAAAVVSLDRRPVRLAVGP